MKHQTNRLINDKSPYLLQHARNPVDWYPWGEEAFEKARREDKPIFLSIGYSTCHWCHVMAHESFEDAEVAAAMNEVFVSIKVDREERPDIDSMYMNVCQALTGSGGWPLTIFMSPDKRPFFAGTYFPPKSRFGRAGVLELCAQVKEVWSRGRTELSNVSGQIVTALTKVTATGPGPAPGAEVIEKAFNELKSRFDPANGGFGKAPKFPVAQNILFLLRYAHRTGSAEARDMAVATCDAMRRGGIYDHLGYGFHRYATDAEWRVPHFEKMLYDQAMISMAYVDAWQYTGRAEYRETASEIFSYVMRDMMSPEGAFYAAEDADSEGVEGGFYLWRYEELEQVLDQGEMDLYRDIYSIARDGNYAAEPGGPPAGLNILHMDPRHRETEDRKEALALARTKLLGARERRMRPLRDDKILTDWNGLMIAALARGAQAFGDYSYAEAARAAANFVSFSMRDSGGRLLHRYRDGEAAVSGTLNDYAFFTWGLLELYEAVFDPALLSLAAELTGHVIDRFRDPVSGGFYFTADDGEELPVRTREVFDNVTPSGNSVTMMNLLRLGHITADTKYLTYAAEILSAFSTHITQMPSAHCYLMCGIMFALGDSSEIVIVGERNSDETKRMLREVQARYIPDKVVLLVSEGDRRRIGEIAPFTRSFNGTDGRPAAYVCRNNACAAPATDIGQMFLNLGIKP